MSWEDILKAKITSLKQAYHLYKHSERTHNDAFVRITRRDGVPYNWHEYKKLREKGHNDADAISLIEDGDDR